MATPRRPHLPLLAGLALAATATATAQRVVLPHGTGGVTVDSSWTVLRQQDLEQTTRPTDPDDGPGRTRLLRTIAELRERQRTAEHLLLHRASAGGGLVLVNAYSDEVAASTDELRADDAITTMRTALEQEFANDGRTARFVDSEAYTTTEPGGVTLRFDLDEGDDHARFRLTIIPSGERLQYFECLRPRDDEAAAAAVAALVDSFDGAKVPPTNRRDLLFGGALGAVAGVIAAMMWRNRQAVKRAQAQAGAAPPTNG